MKTWPGDRCVKNKEQTGEHTPRGTANRMCTDLTLPVCSDRAEAHSAVSWAHGVGAGRKCSLHSVTISPFQTM